MFTFKTNKPTGKWKSFDSDYHQIKLNKSVVGEIENNSWKIRLCVIKDGVKFTDNNKNCKWLWVTLKKEPTSLQDAKDFLNRNFARIIEQYPLHKLEE